MRTLKKLGEDKVQQLFCFNNIVMCYLVPLRTLIGDQFATGTTQNYQCFTDDR